MKPADLINPKNANQLLYDIFNRLHVDGPIHQEDLESLAYIKYFHKDLLSPIESQLMYLLGIFYKIEAPDDFISYTYSIFAETISEQTGQSFTPIQASIRTHILNNKYFSFSAPTSAGKSFLFRELIKDQTGDIIIVVPSRALIAEYLLAIRDLVVDQTDILVLQFIDDVNRKRTKRKIFVVTPERASEIFKAKEKYKPSLFLFDEAQISETPIRGVRFDALVRRVSKVFPNAKKVFAHPFIENPEAQLLKHTISSDMYAMPYNQNAVGKMFLYFNKDTGDFECFSPFIKQGHLLKNRSTFPVDIVSEKLQQKGSVLIYITKSSIYDRSFETTFKKYIDLCNTIDDPKAIEIIEEIEDLIGAKNRSSGLISLMKKGIVIHHGSIPLVVRFLIEKFTNLGFARICFATSTLAQGVNLPFDIVWVENFKFEGSDEDKALALKNLIGRAGRSSQTKNSFDYGFVIIKNTKSFLEKFDITPRLEDISQLNKPSENLPEDLSEFIDAVKEDDINDEYDLPSVKTTRLESDETINNIITILDFLFVDGKIMDGNTYSQLSKSRKLKFKAALSRIFEISLGRDTLTGEKTVLSAAVTILLWQIQGKTFKELLGLRYSYLTDIAEQNRLNNLLEKGQITKEEHQASINSIEIKYSAIPHQLPKSTLVKTIPSRFKKLTIKSFSYDLLVYDTYDFLDKVITFSLSDIYIAAFDQYFKSTHDERAKSMVNYFRYGTDDDKEILLFRYGFSAEEIEIIKKFVETIDEEEIVFSQAIHLPENKRAFNITIRYL